MNSKTLGIVIKRQNFSEADRILTIFTERFGKVKAIAKGVRKIKSHMAGSLEPFILSDLQLHEGKTFYTVTGASIVEDFASVHTDLGKMAEAFYLGELIDKFENEHQKSERVFGLFMEALRAIDGSSNNNLALRIFEINLLKESGFWGDLASCLHCKEKLRSQENCWDGEEGGIICGRCQQQLHHGRAISNDLIKFFRLVEKEGFELIDRFKPKDSLLDEAKMILSVYLSGVLEYDLKTKHFLETI